MYCVVQCVMLQLGPRRPWKLSAQEHWWQQSTDEEADSHLTERVSAGGTVLDDAVAETHGCSKY